MILVIDASVIGHWLLTTRVPIGVLAEQYVHGALLAAPHLVDAEVGHLLRRHVLTGVASLARAQIALEDFLALPIARYPHATLLPRAFGLRDNATIYDALGIPHNAEWHDTTGRPYAVYLADPIRGLRR